MKNRFYQFIAAALVCSVILLPGCEKEKKETAPELPPLSAFAIDVEDFAGESMTKSSIDPKSNFHMVVGALSFWNLALTLSLAIPVASYAEAFNHDAERVDNDTWKWAYNFAEVYSAELVADVEGDSVNVSMYISKTGAYEHLLWYTGKFDILRTGGEWTVFEIPEHENSAWLHITWNADYENDTFDIKYDYVKAEADYEGSYIEYGITNDTDYNAYYNLYNSVSDITYEVNYNTLTHVGTVTDGENQLCWDEEYMDSTCPGAK